MLRDALTQYAALGVAVRLYLPPSDGSLPDDLVPAGVTRHVQTGPDLGARMLHAFLETFAAGAHRAVVIGTDHPTLPSAFIQLAFDELTAPKSISLGPSDDGGYYLLGMRDLQPALFAGMQYSHADVLAHTLDRATARDLDVTLLPPWYDVDDAPALDRLRADLKEAPATAPATAAYLTAMEG